MSFFTLQTLNRPAVDSNKDTAEETSTQTAAPTTCPCQVSGLLFVTYVWQCTARESYLYQLMLFVMLYTRSVRVSITNISQIPVLNKFIHNQQNFASENIRKGKKKFFCFLFFQLCITVYHKGKQSEMKQKNMD